MAKPRIRKTQEAQLPQHQKIAAMAAVNRLIPGSAYGHALDLLAGDSNGAKCGVLELFAHAVLDGVEIDARFQAVVNTLVAEAVFSGSLPSKVMGRPVGRTRDDPKDVANQFYDLRDGGVKYADVLAKLSERFHIDERQIARHAREQLHQVGKTPEERAKWRVIRQHVEQLDLDLNFSAQPPLEYEAPLRQMREKLLAGREDTQKTMGNAVTQWVDSISQAVKK